MQRLLGPTLYGVCCPDIEDFFRWGWLEVHGYCYLMIIAATPIHERIPWRLPYRSLVTVSSFIRWLAKALIGGQK